MMADPIKCFGVDILITIIFVVSDSASLKEIIYDSVATHHRSYLALVVVVVVVIAPVV